MPADRAKKNGMPKPPKGGSTRTHEENQERAYVAASRRSDRSLEARVESARRASEIHKQRTGRGLKVTEQDVMNEEMYEEEDIPSTPGQYLHASQHMMTKDPDFNRRFQDYMTTQLALRTIQVQNQFRNNPQLLYQMNMQFPTPMLAHPHQPQMPNQTQQMQQMQHMQHMQQPQQPSLMQQRMMQQQMNTARQAPYPQRRQSSVSSQQQLDATNDQSQDQTALPMRPYIQRHSSVTETVYHDTPSTPTSVRPSIETDRRPSFPEGTFAQLNSPTQFTNNPIQQYAAGGMGNYSSNNNAGALPRNIQMFMQGTMDPNDPMTSHLMAGSETIPDWRTPAMQQSSQIGKHQSYPTTQGLNSTLSAAPSQAIRDDEPPTASQEFMEQSQASNQSQVKQEQFSLNTPDLSFGGASMGDFFDFETFDTYAQ